MQDGDPRLMSGETVVLTTKKHWAAPVADSGIAVLLIIGAFILEWLQTDQTNGIVGFGNRILNLLAIGAFLVGIGWIIYNIVAWRSAEYAVTTRRVLGTEGLLRRRETDSLLSSISDVKSRSSAVGRALGYGDIQIMTASGEAGADKFTTVVQADAFKKAALEQKSGIGEAAQTAAAVAIAPSTAQSESMATLNQLAALRQSGAITEEEFQAKKVELLSRI